MQAFGRGVSRPANGGGPGGPGKSGGLFGGGQKVGFSVSKADNINPEAQDCYFYYYSTCAKGAQCKFRHCSAALGTEEVCDLWLRDQSCRRLICAFRHSVPERQRGAIPCFWESQSVGCLKPHCPFLHTKPRPQPPTVMDRLDQFKKKEFEGLKVKTLEEIREEKQLASSVTTPTFPHGARESYNLIYTPSHPPPSTSSSSHTSFKLTSVLKTTGLTGGKKKPQIELSTGNAASTSFLQPNAVSQPIAANSAHVSKPFAVQQPAKPAPPLKVGGVTTSVSESSKNLFASRKNPLSVFSPIFSLTAAKKTKNEVKLAEREGREEGGGRKATISAITWGDEEEGEGEGREEAKKESRIIQFQPAIVEPVPATKKVKLTTVVASSSSSSSGILARLGPPPLPKAASSPIKLNTGGEQGGTSLKVGVAIGGRGQSVGGVTDFHVKSLEEIRAGKMKRQEAREKAAITAASGGQKNGDSNTESDVMRVQDQQTNEKNQESVGEVGSVGSTSHARSRDKKIIRVKKRSSVPVEEGVEREVMGGGEGCEDGRGEGGEEEEESSDKKDVCEEVSLTGKLTAPVAKRRKLSRTPLSIVQATPTSDTPTITSSELAVTTAESQLLPNQTTTSNTVAESVAETGSLQKPEVEDMKTSTAADDEGEQEGGREEHVESSHRKMSVSEMKAQIQSELRGRGMSEKISLEQLDSELARWEEELGEVGEEGEGGASDDERLLDSKTDDDLMLEFAEFL